MQFGEETGGEVRFLATLEYQFPLVSSRSVGGFGQQELLRGVVFTDYGQLGLDLNDPTWKEPRLSVGFGVRINVPVLGVPITLDLGWPILYEETDDRQVLYFSLSRR